MKKNASILILFLLFLGCNDQTIIPIKGELIGFVDLLDQSGVALSDKSGVKISIDDTHSVLTNSIGKFEFTDVEPGNYKILFEKDGYGTVKNFNYVFAAGHVPGVVSTATLIGLPTLSTKNVVAEITQNPSIHISGEIQNLDGAYSFIYYIGDKSSVDNLNYYTSYEYPSCCNLTGKFDHHIANNATSLSSIYITAYIVSPVNQYGAYQYYDYEINKLINPSMKQLFTPIKIK